MPNTVHNRRSLAKPHWRGFIQGFLLIFVLLSGLLFAFGVSPGGPAPGTAGYDVMLYMSITCAVYIIGFIALGIVQRRTIVGIREYALWGACMGVGACAGYATSALGYEFAVNGLSAVQKNLDALPFALLVAVGISIGNAFAGMLLGALILTEKRAASR